MQAAHFYCDLPEKCACHFNYRFQPDNYCGRVLNIILFVVYFGSIMFMYSYSLNNPC